MPAGEHKQTAHSTALTGHMRPQSQPWSGPRRSSNLATLHGWLPAAYMHAVTIWESSPTHVYTVHRFRSPSSLMNRFRAGHVVLTCTNVVSRDSRPITFLWPATDHEPHCQHVPINKI